MAVDSATSSPVSKSLYARRSAGGASSFLNSTDQSPVQRMLANQKTTQAAKPGSYFESEDWLRMKAFSIRSRIVMYQNLGLTKEYQMAQQEGSEVVAKYQALLQKQAAAKAAEAMEKEIAGQLGLDTSA